MQNLVLPNILQQTQTRRNTYMHMRRRATIAVYSEFSEKIARPTNAIYPEFSQKIARKVKGELV